MKDGERITISREGDQEPGLLPGDIVIVLDEQEHPVFTRKGMHLFLKMDIQLVESLCGFQKTIDSLDNRHLLITVLPGRISLHYPGKNIWVT
jgi:DnaJ family protein A protein 1